MGWTRVANQAAEIEQLFRGRQRMKVHLYGWHAAAAAGDYHL